MIDWLNLGANALWILGCAVALAVLSYASWEASVYREKFSQRLKRPGIQAALNLGGFLFASGLAATSDSGIEIILWLVLAAAFLAQIIFFFVRTYRKA